MPRVQIVVTINTDPVPGAYHDPEDIRKYIEHEVSRFPESYHGQVELAKPSDLNAIRMEDVIEILGHADAKRFFDWAGWDRHMIPGGTTWYWRTDFIRWLNEIKNPLAEIMSSGFDI